jgi:hypothetical protein
MELQIPSTMSKTMTKGKVAVLLSGRGSTNYPPTLADIVCLSQNEIYFTPPPTVNYEKR